jgi:hypothetical protein
MPIAVDRRASYSGMLAGTVTFRPRRRHGNGAVPA